MIVREKFTGIDVIHKQEAYRELTISEVVEMMEIGYSKEKIAEEVGISQHEVAGIQRIVERRLKAKGKKKNKRGRKANYSIFERRYF